MDYDYDDYPIDIDTYRIIKATTSSQNELQALENVTIELERQVNQLLEQGWKPQGGISIQAITYDVCGIGYNKVTETKIVACQAMVLKP